MKIAVMGAGAMGSMFGGLLRKSGEEVWLVDSWKDHMDKVKQDGLLMNNNGIEEYVQINATTNPNDVGIVDLVIL